MEQLLKASDDALRLQGGSGRQDLYDLSVRLKHGGTVEVDYVVRTERPDASQYFINGSVLKIAVDTGGN